MSARARSWKHIAVPGAAPRLQSGAGGPEHQNFYSRAQAILVRLYFSCYISPMKKQKSPSYHLPGSNALLASLALCVALAAPAGAAQNDFSAGQSDIKAAEKDLRMAEKDFAQAGKVVDEGTAGRTTWSQIGDPSAAESPQTDIPPLTAPGQPARHNKKTPVRNGATVTNNLAPGYDGYMGTYVDPANGDIVTSVIAPSRRQNDQDYQNYPIIIEPDIRGWGNNGWNNNGNNWGYNNWGYGNMGWNGGPGQQVPGYPFPPAYPGFQPSGQVPGYPFPPSHNFGPPPPPPPNGPNYAPSLPGQNSPPPGPPNNPGGIMPNPVPPPGPGFGPGQGPSINPQPPTRPGFGPGHGPGRPPLPPAGMGPGNKPNFGHRPPFGPNFGNRPGFGPNGGPGIPGFGPGPAFAPGFRPHSGLTPPKNPGRPGSMPLVAPNFPPHVEHQPFVDLYRPPLAGGLAVRQGAGVAQRHQSYFVPGSAQSWDSANWQPGQPSK